MTVRVAEQLADIEKRVLGNLKDFQRATVERVDALFRAGQRRVLVSDEVGLGKTLVARGVVAKLARLRQEEGDDLVKVVYICSNATIADQNLQRLRIVRDLQVEESTSSRLSMQHLKIFQQESDPELRKRYIQLIPLTPQTSFSLSNGRGMAKERALMAFFLCRMPLFKGLERQLKNILRMYIEQYGWQCRLDDMASQAKECNRKSKNSYFAYMDKKLEEAANKGPENENCLLQLAELCKTGSRARKTNANAIISALRKVFAKISLDKLEPDLVIMDEFQRFKTLLEEDNDSEEGMLARRFFQANNVRMLLLSATPYKMYSTPDEIDAANSDEHFYEFLTLMDFLNAEPRKKYAFRTVWQNYTLSLKELSQGDTTILSAVRDAEAAMYSTVCRTERLAEPACADVIDDTAAHDPLHISPVDVSSFIEAQTALSLTKAKWRLPTDYVKSSPYLLSFMRDYQVKREIEKYVKENPKEARKFRKKTFWLSQRLVEGYERIAPGNARLAQVMEKVLPRGAERLLWIPASRPWYEPQGVFAVKRDSAKEVEDGQKNPTKTLIFSSWEMVPRMLACMLSYEVERRTVGRLLRQRQQNTEKRLYSKIDRQSLTHLSLETNDGKPAAASLKLFCLLYPSKFLASCWNPCESFACGANLKDIRNQVRQKIEARLTYLGLLNPDKGREDARWYALAPMLLDSDSWFERWQRESRPKAEEGDSRDKVFVAHLNTLKNLRSEVKLASNFSSFCQIGRRPANLLDTLVDMALASPAVCLLRTYLGFLNQLDILTVLPGKAARLFVRRMNSPEAAAVLRLACGKDIPENDQCLQLLRYSLDGNLQAVFDEYAHLLASGLDRGAGRLEKIDQDMCKGLELGSTAWKVDSYPAFVRRTCGNKKEDEERMPFIRTHYAMAFSKGDRQDERDANSKIRLINAFNSPFWPFVLATTSIGQEGLDFHQYCRRVVHWNLPSNPIDLEQREGRINRFKCLAIRQTVAARYGKRACAHGDVWEELFDVAAREEKGAGSSDLIPCWGLRPGEDLVHIERIVPMYPCSKDQPDYERLIQILSLYRLTLGQARQEDLLDCLLREFKGQEETLKKLFLNLAPFYRKNN